MIHRVLLGLLLFACLGCGWGLVYSEHYSRKLSDEWSVLQREQSELELEWQQLLLEQSAITAKAIVHEVARSQLQMVAPEPSDVIYIKP